MARDQQTAGRTIYLVRHGEAASKEQDPERPLTADGRDAVEKVARWAAAVGIRVDEIRHSGKLRAEQTARLFAEQLRPPKDPVTVSGLDPNDDVRPVADALAQETATVMLVGHLPFLGKLVSDLVAGDPDRGLVEFEAAGLVVLRFDGDWWMITCVIHPGVVD